jgi:hypothetical protein
MHDEHPTLLVLTLMRILRLSVRRAFLALTAYDLYGGEICMTSIQRLSVRRSFLALTACDLYGGEICTTSIEPTNELRMEAWSVLGSCSSRGLECLVRTVQQP